MASAPLNLYTHHGAKGDLSTASNNKDISSVAHQKQTQFSAPALPPPRQSLSRPTAATQATRNPQVEMRIYDQLNRQSVGESITMGSKQQNGRVFLWTKVKFGIPLSAVVIALLLSLAGIIIASRVLNDNRIIMSMMLKQNNKTQNMVNNLNKMKISLGEKHQQIDESLKDQGQLMKSKIRELRNHVDIMVGWKSVKQYRYLFGNDDMTWYEAKRFCGSRNAWLAAKGLRDPLVRSDIYSLVGDEKVWIGLNDTNEDGVWFWNDGVRASAYNVDWISNEPNNWGGNQYCGQISTHVYWNELGMGDKECHSKALALCENDLQKVSGNLEESPLLGFD